MREKHPDGESACGYCLAGTKFIKLTKILLSLLIYKIQEKFIFHNFTTYNLGLLQQIEHIKPVYFIFFDCSLFYCSVVY